MLNVQRADRKEAQLYYYKPASERVYDVHRSRARLTGVGGGNGSSKTESCLVELLIHCTGVVPFALRDIGIDWKKKLRGPIQARVVCENLTTVLQPIILPKLRWSHWTGLDEAGGDKGHWGWIPRACLRDGEWDRSWSEKSRMLRLYYRNPDDFSEIVGESTIQFMSYDQDPADFESGDLHLVLLDEPPPLRIFRANEARTMRVAGRILMAMTWPDDPSINCDYIFDEVYEPARAGHEQIDWIEISTLENRFLNQDSIRAQSEKWDDRMRAVRIHGRPIRFSNRIHPMFTDVEDWFCFACGEIATEDEGRCWKCKSDDLVRFNHVEEFEVEQSWPVIWVVDPHPRKPHMSAYFVIEPDGDLSQIAELERDGSPSDLKILCDELEGEFHLNVRQRLMDPRMGSSPANARRREATWQDEFRDAGLPCELADPSDVGRELVNEYLRPDRDTRRPRIRVHPRCAKTILQFKRYMWADWKLSDDRDMKQTPKQKYDDYPAIYRYLLNSRPSFHGLAYGYKAIRTTRTWQNDRRRRPSSWPRTRLEYP